MAHNITRIHTPLRCARLSDVECDNIFRLTTLNQWSLDSVKANVKEESLLHVKLPKGSHLRESVDQGVKNNNDTNVLFDIGFPAASYSFKHTRKFWSRAYARARRTHPTPCRYSLDPHKIHVAVHIRQGDVLRFANMGFKRLTKLRFLPLEYFSAVIKGIYATFKKDSVALHLFTDGRKEDMAKLMDEFNFVSFNNNNPVKSLHNLAGADVLVCSKSGFSQLAAVISSADGQAIKLIPDADWPSYEGIPNTVVMEQELLGNLTRFSDRVKAAAFHFIDNDTLTNSTDAIWFCPSRPFSVIRESLLLGIRE
ncbi:hypothetical protein HDU97_000776 [Phlyctochytrium planicorne]|nr:hypothetical protein HDU97_000776 [Phlyctochytrium planicorne]